MRLRSKFICGAVLGASMFITGCQSPALISAKLYLQEDQPEHAREQLLRAREEAPDNPEVHYLLGKVYGMEEDWKAMSESLERSLELSSRYAADITQVRRHFWTQQYNAGVTLATAPAPDYVMANQAFKAATTISPGEVAAWRNLGYTYYQLGEMDAAIQTYGVAVEHAPEDTATVASLATLCLQQSRYDLAAAALEQLVRLTPEDSEAWVNLGIVQQQLDKVEDAEYAYQRALALNPDLYTAHFGLGNLYWNQERYGDAAEHYGAAVDLHPAAPEARFNLAMTYLQQGEDRAALPLLEELTRQTPDNGAVWSHLSLIYARMDRLTDAQAAEARARELGH